MRLAFLVTLLAAAPALAQTAADPRPGLAAGWTDAGEAAWNLEHVAHLPRPEGFVNPENAGDFLYMNSDIAFQGTTLFMGNFQGVQIYDIADPASPRLRATLRCPGGQGDVSVHGNLLFMSVEMPNGRLDCGLEGSWDAVSSERFRGVRVFDISDVEQPRQVAAVQTCRGSHTHTLVPDVSDPSRVFLYVAGTSNVRPADELAGCSAAGPDEDPETSYFRIEVIEVPLARPQDARIINAPRIFADPATGRVDGLWAGGSHGEGTQASATTDQCHDLTVYPEIGLAAGACSGNGLLLDISDPANPVRIDEVVDTNFAYWHSATFNNDGSTVLFTDEWGGGMAPRCRSTDRPEWGANALFRLGADRQMTHVGYYKLPAAQGETENCVAHNGSLVPVPGRDVMAQAWYQGGLSLFDFTDPEAPVEIAYFDRGPMSAAELQMGGYWSVYWYNGYLYGSEIGRGLDVFRLTPSEHLTAAEIAAAASVRETTANPQTQTRIAWAASPALVGALADQLERSGTAPADVLRAAREAAESDREAMAAAAAGALDAAAGAPPPDAARLHRLADALQQLADRP